MKIAFRTLVVFIFIFPGEKLFAQNATNSTPAPISAAALLKISAVEATNYYNPDVVITGKVAQVTIRPTITFINLDKPFPDSPFAVVIIHKHSSFYGDANALRGKTIEVKGEVKEYNGKPEMMLDSTNQLTVIGVTNLEFFLKPKTTSATNAPPVISNTNAPPRAIQATNLSEIM
jgi:hypothetical protein